MASICWKVLILLTSSVIIRAISEQKHVLIKELEYETFVHNLKDKYFLDKGETIEVWAEITPFPWQDNRLIAGISDPALLEFNASCVEKVISKGVVIRNMTAQISQFVTSKTNRESLKLDNKGNATFFIEIFNETKNVESIRAEAAISVGCPPGRFMTVSRNSDECSLFKNYSFINPSFSLEQSQKNQSEAKQYNFSVLGCPVEANYYDLFKPSLLLYENVVFLREVTANYVLFELNGRLDYSYSATMEQVLCLREAQTWQNISVTDTTDPSKSWNQQNYKSCFISENMQTPNFNQPYEILNKSGLSAISWNNEGIYIFKATVVDPVYSFCNLTTVFAVHVHGIKSSTQGLPPFLVLGTSMLALVSSVFFLFVTSKLAVHDS